MLVPYAFDGKIFYKGVCLLLGLASYDCIKRVKPAEIKIIQQIYIHVNCPPTIKYPFDTRDRAGKGHLVSACQLQLSDI